MASRSKPKKLARRRATWEVWVVGDDGDPIERVAEPTTKKRAEAIRKAVGDVEGVRLEIRSSAATTSLVVPSAARDRISKALDIARDVHRVVGATYARGQVAEVRMDPLSRTLAQHLAGSPKVQRLTGALMDLLAEFGTSVPKKR